jgi:predicted SAM-dependent methyltransferase
LAELLIGCGNDRRKRLHIGDSEWHDLTTIDHDPNCGADVVHDLEQLPWPFADDSFDEAHANCVLEHMGQQGDFESFFAHFGEIYRILKPGGMLFGIVPMWNNVWAWADPSHRRVIAKETLFFLDQSIYAAEVGKSPMTDFRWLWKGDFEPYAADEKPGHLWFALKAHKPARTF